MSALNELNFKVTHKDSPLCIFTYGLDDTPDEFLDILKDLICLEVTSVKIPYLMVRKKNGNIVDIYKYDRIAVYSDKTFAILDGKEVDV